MMAAIPDAIRPRLGQFVRLLGSDQPGEVVAAAAALRRALAGVGADLHDLAGTIERPAVVVVERPEPAPRARRSRKARQPSPGSVEFAPARRRQVVDALSKASARGVLSSWEADFTAFVIATLQGSRPRLSARQNEIVERLLSKYGEGRAWV